MRQYIPVITLAAALALLLGVLLSSDNAVYAANPVFGNDTFTREVPENTPPGVNIGAPISATDADEDGEDNDDIEFGDTLTYSLSGTDAASFDIDSSTGQLITKAPLDFENPSGGTGNNNNTYEVTVTVKDSSGTSDTQDVTITVTNVAEEPGAPAAPTVVSTETDNDAATYELKVIWYPPDDTVEDVISYSVEYKKTTETSFGTTGVDAISGTTVMITGLEVDTSYQVRVRATNSAGDGPWSLSSVGSTNKKDNTLPAFGTADVTRNVLENADPGLVVGFRVSATDDDNVLPLAYRLHGPDANSFDLQASTGQIRTKRGVVYDFETKSTLNVTVTVSDGQGGTDATAVTISVTDVPEAPSRPARPTVRATQGSSRSLDVSWTEPDNMGPAITGYDLRYRKGNSGSFTLISSEGTGTNYTIAGTDDDGDDRLTPGSSYEVYVRAQNGESPSEWSAAGTGRTSIGNSEPTFDDRDKVAPDVDGNLPAASTERTVAENTRPGQSVGRAVGAVDGNGDRRTYRLVAAPSPNDGDVDKFGITATTGQILTKDPLNHEAQCSDADASLEGGHEENCTYTVVVQVWDGLDGDRNEQDTSSLDDADDTNDTAIIDDEITVKIMVSDVAEKPAAPTVTVTSDVNGTQLVVTWDVPDNTGPAITGYRLECTGHEVPDDQCPRDIEATVVSNGTGTQNITELTADKDYRVRMRADNDEGQGAWSSWARQSTNKEDNALPTFTSPPTELYVVENAPSARQPLTSDEAGQIVTNIQKDDGDGDSPLTLSLEGPDAGRFTIDASTGQIRTKSKLNHEDAECNPDGAGCTYSVRVKLSDPNGGSIFHALTINVTDEDEPPEAPEAPRVTATSGSGWSLEVTWNEPSNDGPPITGYQIRYRKTEDSAATWRQWPSDESNVTDRSAKITTIPDPDDGTTQVHLEPRTQYEVQVRALNGEGNPISFQANPHDNWSSSGRGTTGASNRRPVFDSTLPAVVTLEVEENTRSGQSVGSAVEATDPDGNRLTYTLEGPGKDSFTITSAGQIRTRSPLNHEERDEHSLTVKVNDGQRKNNSVAAKSVTIEVTDRPEQPSAPGAPRVAGIPGSTDSVRVTWDEPANTGPAITHYSVQYAVSGSSDAFQRVTVPTGNADRSVIITGLTAGTRYQVQVRAEIAAGHSDWSRSGTGSPNPDVANRNPAFSGGSRTFSVAENTPPGTDVGSLVAALDPDDDVLTYILEGIDADSFDIITTNGAGQIQTKPPLNFEEKASYSVAVRARDGRGGTDAVNVTINVTDVNTEAPDTPFAPTVTALSSTSVQVSWDAPENTGPPITDYDYRYRAVTDSEWTEVTNTTITGTTVPIEDLTPSTSYDVEVRAKNDEGTSEWSNPGNGATRINNPPAFSSVTTSRSVAENTAAGENIGSPVTATDDDPDDTLTYTLSGLDASSFSINDETGQLMTGTPLDYEVKLRYTVTVTASDGTDSDEIQVTIDVIDVLRPSAPSAPTVEATMGSTTSLDVSWDEPVNTGPAITDYDVQYRVVSAGSFMDWPHSGTDRTTTITALSEGTSYEVQVLAKNDEGTSGWSESGTGSTSINNPPAFSSVTTSRSVAENTAAGENIGSPVTATDGDLDDTLTYTLSGLDASSFSINDETGQLMTGTPLDYEVKRSYTVTVTASDGTDSDEIQVTIDVIDVLPPSAPSAPTVEATMGSTTSLDVSWDEPVNTGPAITDYDIQYRVVSAGSFMDWPHSGTDRTTTITALSEGTSYEVQVLAKNDEGTSGWSESGTGSTSINNPPAFSSVTTSRSVAENTAAGENIGSPVTATDGDLDDTLTYTLSGLDASSFSINDETGQLMTGTPLDYEVKRSYTVTVTASDGTDSDEIQVTIDVIDVLPPSAPSAPTVEATMGSTTSLDVSWDEPVNTGPAITDYDIQYRVGSAGSFMDWPHSGTDRTTTITALSEGTSYEVQVLAKNDEDIGPWSESGTGSTSINNPPEFVSPRTTRSVAENTPAGTYIDDPVSATDADPNDTLTYSLSGTDASSFNIDDETGQLMTSVPLDYEDTRSYSVTVSASDGRDSAEIQVTVSVTDMYPGCTTQVVGNTALTNDCEALLDSKAVLEGTNGIPLDWSERRPMAHWDGIYLSGTPIRVTRLNLDAWGLSGTIPASLARLSELTRLNLRSNPGLSGEIPDALGNLGNLRLLNLHSNSHTGAVPDLRGIAGLEELYLANNADYDVDGDKVPGSGLTGQIPTWLNGMTNMEELWLWGNSLTGTVPNLSGMTSLDKLKLANNNLTGGVPQASTLPPNMTWLIIDRNPFGGTIPDLSSLSRLRLLWLHSNQLTGSVPSDDMLPASLDDLNLRDNRLTGGIPDLSNLDNLTRLRLHNNSLSGEVPATLGDLDSLKQLWLHNEDATKTDNGNNSFTSIAAGVGDLSDTLIEIALNGNPWNANACVPVALANVAKNDYTAAGIEVCDGS